jgi:hypothetical protein
VSPAKASLFEAIVEHFWKVETICGSPLTSGNLPVLRRSRFCTGAGYTQDATD